MDRNVKIALGCGGAGCLGLIVVAVAVCLLYFFMAKSSTNRNTNFNYNRSSRSSTTRNANENSTNNDNESTSSDSSNSNSSSSSSSSMSDDARHKLFHAASVTGDAETIKRVGVKIGILKDDDTPTDDNLSFITQHAAWVFRNKDFVQSINSQAKARAYVDAHIND